MKYVYQLFRYILFSLFFLTSTFALTLTDDFEINNGGWQYNTTTPTALPTIADPTGSSNKVGELAHQKYAFKLYALGSGYKNDIVRVQFDIYAQGKWNPDDFIYIYLSDSNGSNQLVYGAGVPGANNSADLIFHLDFNTTADANGNIYLYINPYSSKISEVAYLDNVTVQTASTPPIMGNIPDDTLQQYTFYNLDLSGYVTQTDGNPILYYNYSCPGITGLSFDSLSGIISGYPANAGTFTCKASAIDVNGESNIDTFILTIQGSAQSYPPIVTNIPSFSFVVNTPISIGLSSYVVPTDGDPILAYTLTGTLPTGLSFDAVTGQITGLPLSEGNTTLSLTATDKDGESNASTFVLSILPKDVNTNHRNFALRYQQTFTGKMLTIGNTILVAPEKQSETDLCDKYTDFNGPDGEYLTITSLSNDKLQLCEYYADTTVKFPTTKATLPPSKSGGNAKVKWAGLYWQSLVKNDYNIAGMQIKLKHTNLPNPSYATVDYTTLDYKADDAVSGYTNYAAFADVTAYFQDNNLTAGDIYVGDIPTVEGNVTSIGTYGAWTLVVIYEDTAEPLQNFSIYDGWQKVDANNNVVDINISGFYTPKNAPNGIVSQVSVFTAEGDANIGGDELKVRPSKQPSFTTLTTFDSSINTAVTFARDPEPTNNQGIDIQSFALGATGENIILPEESSMTLQFTSNPNLDANGNIVSQDTYWPSMVAFSAELYVPQLCYDYTVSFGDQIRVPAEGRDVNSSTFGGLPLQIEFLLRSEEADFIYFDTKANITFQNPSSPLTYNHDYAAMGPANVNTYFRYIDGYTEIESNASAGQLAVGSNVIGNANNNGGVLPPKQTTYAILGYDVATAGNPQGVISTRFDIHFESKIQFDPYSAPVTFTFSTDANETKSFRRCDINQTYKPIHLGFNVERVGERLNEPLSSRFTLWTQVTGRPYSLDLVTYNGGVVSASHTPFDYRGAVEVELIDSSAFQNDGNAGFDTTCQRPNAIGTGTLIAFDPNGETPIGRHTIQIPADLPGYIDTQALRDATFRLWVVTVPDANNTRRVITHQCTDKTNSDDCFGKLYRNTIDVNATGKCTNECLVKNAACYSCLKIYYSTPICARDNFAIRPESFDIKISDDQDKTSGVTPVQIAQNSVSQNSVRLAAGYDYHIAIDTTTVSATKSTGYFNNQFVYSSNIPKVPDIYTAGSLAMLEFDTTRNGASCFDTNQSTIALSFEDGSLRNNTHFRFPNVGRYKLWLSDSNWTIVDHADYANKPFLNVPDCDSNSSNSALNTLAGCTFTSINGNQLDILADIYPYYFSMSNIALQKQPDNKKPYTFYNDFSSVYYQDLLAQPIDTSVSYIGLLIAKDKQGARVSNYTKGCAAQDVILDINITTDSANTDTISPLNQYLQHTSSIDTSWHTTASKLDSNVTLTKDAFLDTQLTTADGVTIKPGKAQILLHTTFKKPKTAPIDPIKASYHGIACTSPNSYSKADMGTRIPEGNNTKSNQLIYYFAKVRSRLELYDNITQSEKNTPLFVDIYCGLGDASCKALYNLGTPSRNAATNWYSAAMYDSNTDGNITQLVPKHIFGQAVAPSVTPNNNIAFKDVNASRADVNVSITGGGRPTIIEVTIQTPPWLSYNPLDLVYGYPQYRLRFIGNTAWSGVGKTGKVVETTSSTAAVKRMNW